MRLINCHIVNFGKLSDFDFEFSEGTNVIFEDNGYGKSTLSAFLRVMLYGFDNETKKGELIKERSKYTPWQGGVYGGNVTLEINNFRYIITRQFGKKESEDFFELRDADTMLISNDYDSGIGAQIFGIDSDSFKKTVMFSQNDCETGSTDGINAKLGNLTESTDDINNFEKVDEAFHKLMNDMTDSRKTGSRYKLKQEIYELQSDIRRKDLIEAEYQAKKELLEQEKNRIAQLKEDLAAVLEKKNRDAMNRGFYVVKGQYEKLNKERYDLENDLAGLRNSNLLLEHVFSENYVSDERLDEINDKLNDLKNLRSKKTGEELSFSELSDYNRLNSCFERKSDPAGDLDEALSLLDETEEADSEQKQIEIRMASIGYVEGAHFGKAKLISGLFFVVLGCILALGAGYIYSKNLLQSYVSYILGGAAALLIIIAIIMISGYINELKNHKVKYAEFMDCKENLEDIKSRRNQAKNKLLSILATYNIAFDKYDTGRRICRLRDDYDYYKRLCARKRSFDLDGNSIKITQICDELDEFFIPFMDIVEGEDYYEKLYSLRSKKRSYELYQQKVERLSELKTEIKNMEDAPDFLSVRDAYEPETSDDSSVESNVDKANAMIDEALDNCMEYRNRIEALEEELDAISDEETALGEKIDELEKQNTKAELVERTRYYLNEAKTSFVKRYSEPITNSFRKYFELIDGSDAANYSFDANTNLNVYSAGKIRKPEAFSRGMRDLAGIAFRMSLTEAMYKSEKPYLIMDDPFVNLDDTRINGALKLLENISKEYQIIYFTCSSSRVPN